MGLFDIFKKKKEEEKAHAPEQKREELEKKEREELSSGLEKTKEGIFGKLARAVAGKSKVDEKVLDSLEEILITSDVGVETTVRIIDRNEARVSRDK